MLPIVNMQGDQGEGDDACRVGTVPEFRDVTCFEQKLCEAWSAIQWGPARYGTKFACTELGVCVC